MKNKITQALLLGTVFLFGCTKHDEHSQKFAGTEFRVSEQGKDFKLPSELWDFLMGQAPVEAKTEAHASKSEDAKSQGGHQAASTGAAASKNESAAEETVGSLLYAPLRVLLFEKTPGVLIEKEIRILLPEGGGEVDLSRFTTGAVGTFYVNFEWAGQEKDATEAHVAFYSRTKKRRVGSELVGAGCKKFLDITQAIKDLPPLKGLTVNTSRNFHTTVLGGHFLFSWMQEGTRRVSHVSFIDKKSPELFCENEK